MDDLENNITRAMKACGVCSSRTLFSKYVAHANRFGSIKKVI